MKNVPWNDESPTDSGMSVQENFLSWFGASKAVTKDGLPRVFYHGTRRDIAAFDSSKLGLTVDNPTTCFGFFFTGSADDAAYWATKRPRFGVDPDAHPLVMPVYLAISNPVTISAEQFQYYLRTARESTIKSHLAKWIDKGHDGILTVRDGEDWAVAFKPDQIKSAIGNAGLYLSGNPELTDQLAAVSLRQASVAREVIQPLASKKAVLHA